MYLVLKVGEDMILITYKKDDGTLHTLMVDEFRDMYNVGTNLDLEYMCIYRVGNEKVEIRKSAILSSSWIDPAWQASYTGTHNDT